MKALVTGGVRGIGAAIVQRLRADGMEVLTLDLADGADFQVDVAGGELPDLGDIDVCVSNAGVTNTIAPAHKMTREQWDLDIGVNLTGAFRVIQACLPGMRERGYGRIVVISSGAARDGLKGQVAYAASKAGLLGMVKTIAAENVKRDMTANAVLPGVIETEVIRSLPEEWRERVTAMLPTGRMGTVEEVAGLVAYLASRQAGYITGETIAIDGGGGLNKVTLGAPGHD